MAKRPANKPAAAAAKPTVTRVRTTTRKNQDSAGFRRYLDRRYYASLSFGAIAAELLGTFILALLVLNTASTSGINYVIVFFALAALVVVFLPLSGAHFNPALSLGMWVVRRMRGVTAVAYVVAQVVGAMLALVVANIFLPESVNPLTGQSEAGQLYAANDLPTDTARLWKAFGVEAIGTFVLAFGVVSAYLSRGGALAKGFAYAGAFLVGALLLAGSGILNPALAMAVQAVDFSVWALSIYVLAPILGAVAAMLLNRLMQKDVDKERL